MLGASGAIAAVLGAYFVLYPTSRVLTLVLVFPVKIPAWVFLGLWFVYQLIQANNGLTSAQRRRRRRRILRPRRRIRVRADRRTVAAGRGVGVPQALGARERLTCEVCPSAHSVGSCSRVLGVPCRPRRWK